jgi:hypothetical protein
MHIQYSWLLKSIKPSLSRPGSSVRGSVSASLSAYKPTCIKLDVPRLSIEGVLPITHGEGKLDAKVTRAGGATWVVGF